MSRFAATREGGRIAPALYRLVTDDPRKVVWVFALSAAYATLRYNVAKGVPWADWPSYIANKVLAVSALVLLAWAALRKLRGTGGAALFMRWGGLAAIAHVPLSFCLMSPAYFDKLFDHGKLSLAGGASLLLASFATGLLELGARRARYWSDALAKRATALLLALSALHTMIPSAASWLKPETWPAHLPPLTLLSTLPAGWAIALWAGRELHFSVNRPSILPRGPIFRAADRQAIP